MNIHVLILSIIFPVKSSGQEVFILTLNVL